MSHPFKQNPLSQNATVLHCSSKNQLVSVLSLFTGMNGDDAVRFILSAPRKTLQRRNILSRFASTAQQTFIGRVCRGVPARQTPKERGKTLTRRTPVAPQQTGRIAPDVSPHEHVYDRKTRILRSVLNTKKEQERTGCQYKLRLNPNSTRRPLC